MNDGNAARYLHESPDGIGLVSAQMQIRCPGCDQFIAVSRSDAHPTPYSECGHPDDGICSEHAYSMDRDAEEWRALFGPSASPPPPPSDALCAATQAAHTSARIVFALERDAAIEAAIAQGKHEITEDVRRGNIPLDMVHCFADLHGHTDANGYASISDDDVSPFVWHAANDIQGALDVWIRSGGLREALANHIRSLADAIQSSTHDEDSRELLDMLGQYIEACETAGYAWPDWNEHLHMTCSEIVDDTFGCAVFLLHY